jgi:hypothetical protein
MTIDHTIPSKGSKPIIADLVTLDGFTQDMARKLGEKLGAVAEVAKAHSDRQKMYKALHGINHVLNDPDTPTEVKLEQIGRVIEHTIKIS